MAVVYLDLTMAAECMQNVHARFDGDDIAKMCDGSVMGGEEEGGKK